MVKHIKDFKKTLSEEVRIWANKCEWICPCCKKKTKAFRFLNTRDIFDVLPPRCSWCFSHCALKCSKTAGANGIGTQGGASTSVGGFDSHNRQSIKAGGSR